MKKFIFKILVFNVIFIGVILLGARLNSLNIEKQNFQNFNTEESVILIPKNQPYDVVLLGLSHARNFSRHRNHQRLEKQLDVTFINLGKGGGKGNVSNQYSYLKHFYSRQNKADQIVYVISMPMLFAKRLDNNSYTLENETFRFSFFFDFMLGPSRNKSQKLYTYVRHKFTPEWKKLKPYSMKSKPKVLEEINTKKITNGFKAAYGGLKLNYVTFEENLAIVEKTFALAQKHNSKIKVLITPSVFGKWPGHDDVIHAIDSLSNSYNIEIFDYAEVYMNEKKYFYDHHHLNTNGVVHFSKNYLQHVVKD